MEDMYAMYIIVVVYFVIVDARFSNPEVLGETPTMSRVL